MIKKAVFIERAPAKVNLFLDILAKREDGYHDLATVFQAISLQDHLTFEIKVECGDSDEIDFEIHLDSTSEELRAIGMNNSVTTAIEAYFTRVPQDQIIATIISAHFDIFIDKNIPLQAGLAGGSADAAATLRVLNKFFEENFNWSLSRKELLEVALEVGSDVPFCLLSTETPRVYAESRGEVFIETKFPKDFDKFKHVIVVKPDFGIDTSEAFELLSEKIKKFKKAKLGYFNRFEEVIFPNYPELQQIKQDLLDIGYKKVLMSGSGSAILGFLDDKKYATAYYETALAKFPAFYKVFSTEFL